MGHLRLRYREIIIQIAAIRAVYPDLDISVTVPANAACSARAVALGIYLYPRTMRLGLTVPVLIVLEPCHRISIPENTSPISSVTERVPAGTMLYNAIFINGHMVPGRVALAAIGVGIEFNGEALTRHSAIPDECTTKLRIGPRKISAYRSRIAAALDKGECEAVPKISARAGIDVLKPEIENNPHSVSQ
jgi:hypothetical protein